MDKENLHVKKQHFVPRFLLRNFSNESDKIYCYDKINKKQWQQNISEVAHEKYFYDLVKGQRKNSLEYLMAKAESDAAPVISRLINDKDLAILSKEERVIVALFVALQLTRTKTALQQTKWINKQLIEGIKKIQEGTEAKLDFIEHPVRKVWLSGIFNTPDFAKILVQKLWFLLESDNKFYISDNPVVKQNWINKDSNRNMLGLKSEGIEIYFPLSPSLVLAMYCEKAYALMKDTKLPICAPENIENMNWLQIIYADRHIFSSQNDFELVKDMMEKGDI